MPTAQDVPVAYHAVGFEPPSAGLWLELQWFPNGAQNYGMADTGPTLLQGFAQLSACDRPGRGLAPASTLADAVVEAFAKGTTFAGMRVYRKPAISSVIEDPARLMLPVTVMWRGFDR